MYNHCLGITLSRIAELRIKQKGQTAEAANLWKQAIEQARIAVEADRHYYEYARRYREYCASLERHFLKSKQYESALAVAQRIPALFPDDGQSALQTAELLKESEATIQKDTTLDELARERFLNQCRQLRLSLYEVAMEADPTSLGDTDWTRSKLIRAIDQLEQLLGDAQQSND
jgi:tetratricopeptide (TPR) repeat protein